MRALTFYLLYPIIFFVAKSPFWILYAISDSLYIIIYYVAGYRKAVVYKNLKNSFPEKSDKEIKQIGKAYYQYLCDLLLESLKTTQWNEKDVKSRVTINNVEMLNDLYDKGKSIVIVMGHLGNWEWAGPCFSLNCKHQLFVVYQPLSHPLFEKMFIASRTKFNTKIIPRNNTLRAMIANKETISATALIADQAPTPVNTAIWMDFLNQDTAVFNGPEKIGKMLDYPIVNINVDRVKRGYYEITPTLLFEKPKETADNEITATFFRTLERGIKERPATWLWSHRRWKYTR